jgi:hypothetical protein
MLDIGSEMAEILTYQIRSQIEDPEAARATVSAYATLAQSVRRTIMLHEKLGQPKKNPARRILVRRRIIRDVEDAIAREARSPAEQETLHAEFIERLDRPDLEEDIADRPAAEIITDICRDLGVADLSDGHPAMRRSPHDIAILNLRAAQLPGTPPAAELLTLLATAPPRLPEEDYAAMDTNTLMRRVGRFREP